MPYLLDRNIISEAVAVRPNPGVARELERHQSELVTAATLTVLPYDGPVAARHAAERARLEGRGLTAPFVDGQIAATAQVHGLVLVTRNTRDFEAFKDLRVGNWFEE